MILKFLLVVAVIAIVYFMFIKKKPAKNVTKKSKTKESKATDMVACVSCGTYIDLDDAIISSNKYYCSDECVKG